MTKIIDSFGGGKRTKPEWIMAIPQPDGVAKTIRTFLNPFFRLTPDHWGGWHLRTYPILQTLRFLDAERTGATVKFRSSAFRPIHEPLRSVNFL